MREENNAVDGAPSDGVGHTNVGPDVLARFEDASDRLSAFKVRPLASGTNPRERLYMVAFDGTGNNKFRDPLHATNVAKIYDELVGEDEQRFDHFKGAYIVGPGTQKDFFEAKLDAIRGSSYKSNIDEAYEQLVLQANRWAAEDPTVDVRVKSIGFSRGASQVPGFARLLHEKGIPDLDSKVELPDGSTHYTRYIGEPGKVLQAVGLFDPVATGVPLDFDRRLPPSVISGFQITAADEKRMLFLSDEVIPPGLSADGRFLNVMVPGAHSDVGGGYLRDGLSIRCGNLMWDYCNALSAAPYLTKEHEPTDVRLNVIHRSKEGEMIFRLDPRDAERGTPAGTSRVLFPADAGYAGSVPHLPEPVDARLLDGMASKHVAIGPPNPVSYRPAMPPATADALERAGRSVPLAPTIVHGIGAVASAADAVSLVADVRKNRDAGNATAADAHMLRFASRNAAGWAGGQTFMTVGAALGFESGPGMFVTGAAGGLVGFIAGNRLADAVDEYQLNHQRGTDGRTWRWNGLSSWELDAPPVPGVPSWQPELASREESSWLDYRASSRAVEMALGRDYVPRDPYAQPASPMDPPSLETAHWIHDAWTHQWHRDVALFRQEHGPMFRRRDVASPARAAQLDEQAKLTTMENATESPATVALRYRVAYDHEGWKKHGPMPEAVSRALVMPVDKVMASDGHAYDRDGEGHWSREGWFGSTKHAEGLVKEELDDAWRIAPAVTAHIAAHPVRLDDPLHPDHTFFRSTRDWIVKIDEELGRVPDHHTDRLASALAVEARAKGLQRIDEAWITNDGARVGASQEEYNRLYKFFCEPASVSTNEANTPMEESGARWPQAMQQFEQHEQERTEFLQRLECQRQEQALERAMRGPSMSR